MSEIQVGDMVRIVRYVDNPNPVYDQKHFAIGSMHIVKAVVDDPVCVVRRWGLWTKTTMSIYSD